MSSESFCQQMDSSSSAIQLLYSPQRLYARGLTLISVLLTLAGRERQWVMICFSGGSIKEQAAWAETTELQDTDNSSYWQLRTCTPHLIITQI